MPNETSGRSLGLQHGAGVGQSPSGHHGVHVGPSQKRKERGPKPKSEEERSKDL